jgi:hypothetical protein
MKPPNDHQRTCMARGEAEPFLRWVVRAQPGWSIEYHVGRLAMDRRDEPRVTMIANIAAAAAEIGLAMLTQEKDQHAPGYRYTMHRTAKRCTYRAERGLRRQLRDGAADSPATAHRGSQRSLDGRILPPVSHNASERQTGRSDERSRRSRELGERLFEKIIDPEPDE